jgi:hypothetical protein
MTPDPSCGECDRELDAVVVQRNGTHLGWLCLACKRLSPSTDHVSVVTQPDTEACDGCDENAEEWGEVIGTEETVVGYCPHCSRAWSTRDSVEGSRSVPQGGEV